MKENFNLKKVITGDYEITTDQGHVVRGFNALGTNAPIEADTFEGFIDGVRHEFTREGVCITDPSVTLEIEFVEDSPDL